MAESQILTFRLSDRERANLDGLAEELACSRTDVLRFALRGLRRSNGLRTEIRAANVAEAFLQRLREHYGGHAQMAIEFSGDEVVTRPKIAGELVPDVLIESRREGGLTHLDLVDELSGIAIRNFCVIEDETPMYVVPLRLLWVVSPVGPPGARDVRELPDGATEITAYDDDGHATVARLDSKLSQRFVNDHALAEFV